MQPLVSVIIPTYNRASLLGQTLDSIIQQTYEYWECLVIDDGSSDYTTELLEFYCEIDKRIQFYPRTKDRKKGANACRNYGFELSRGNYVNWFDSDDIMHRDKLKIQVEALINSQDDFSICQTIIFNNSLEKKLGLRSRTIQSDNILNDYLTERISFLTQAPLWRKSFLISQNKLFDEELQAAQEWEFHCRVLASYNRCHIIETPLVYLRKHQHSLTYNKNHNLRIWNYFLARLKVYRNPDIILDRCSIIYLQDYLLHTFKKFIRSLSFKNSINSLFLYIFTEKEFGPGKKVFASLSVISYMLFNKGHFLLKRVNYGR